MLSYLVLTVSDSELIRLRQTTKSLSVCILKLERFLMWNFIVAVVILCFMPTQVKEGGILETMQLSLHSF